MNKFLSIVFLFAVVPLLAQETQTRAIGPFSGINVAEGIDVYLKKGDKESARVEVTGTQVGNVITEVSGSYLKVHMKDGHYRKTSVKVYVTYVKLEKLSASSGGNIFSEESLKSGSLKIHASSAGSIEIGAEADRIEISASSAGQVEVRGKTTTLDADASSGGQINAYDLEAKKVTAEASSGGEAKVSVSDDIMANASSGGSVRYRGDPTKSMTNSSSGGSVKKSN